MIRRILRAIVVALLLLLAFSLPFGPLFPWSPWKPGYATLHLQRADIHYAANGRLPGAFLDIDTDIRESEQFHRLKIPQRIQVILCRNWGDFHRFMPTLGQVGAATLETGTAIYITPRIAERGLDYREFLRHEISHATLNQNQTLLQAHAARKAPWFFEGLAVSFGRQKAYITPQEFTVFSMARDLVPIVDPAKHRTDLPSDIRYDYQVWRYFLEYQISSQGRDKFQQLLIGMKRDPGGSERVFQDVYGISLPDGIRRFRADVVARKWSPVP